MICGGSQGGLNEGRPRTESLTRNVAGCRAVWLALSLYPLQVSSTRTEIVQSAGSPRQHALSSFQRTARCLWRPLPPPCSSHWRYARRRFLRLTPCTCYAYFGRKRRSSYGQAIVPALCEYPLIGWLGIVKHLRYSAIQSMHPTTTTASWISVLARGYPLRRARWLYGCVMPRKCSSPSRTTAHEPGLVALAFFLPSRSTSQGERNR